jgi:hypothetical protein
MARAMLATALAQAAVTAIALIAGMRQNTGSAVSELARLNGFFVALWIAPALLFRRAGLTSYRLESDSQVCSQQL